MSTPTVCVCAHNFCFKVQLQLKLDYKMRHFLRSVAPGPANVSLGNTTDEYVKFWCNHAAGEWFEAKHQN